MKRNKIMILSLFVSVNVFAAPGSSVTYLMNDSVSMFEWGLYRIEDILSDVKFEDLDLVFRNIGRAEYDWDANRINIGMTIYPSNKQLSKIGAKKACKQGIVELKKFFGSELKPEYRRFIGINTYFKRKGFEKKNVPGSIDEDLENITKFTINIYSSENDKPNFSSKAVCTSMLLKSDIYFKDK